MIKIKIDDDVVEWESTGDDKQVDYESCCLIEAALMHLRMSNYNKLECASVALSALGKVFS